MAQDTLLGFPAHTLPFRITAKTTIYYAAGDEKQKKDAEFLASHIKEVTGIGV